jgi:hypothetical protein
MMKRLLAIPILTGVLLPAQIAVKNQGYVPFSEEPILYRSTEVKDPVAQLQLRLKSGQASLRYEQGHGYLRSVLEQLHVPVSSQTLVFSKTSFQYRKITPQAPRALYFNDDVYVGQVHDGKVLEFVSFDPAQGAIFYILDEQQKDRPVFERAELDCTQCHVAAGTRNVPGVLLRSIFTTPSGNQAARTPAYITGHESPLAERWGGWYVTGALGNQRHMGNAMVTDKEHPDQIDREAGANLTDLSKFIDTPAFLSPKSDVVAHLVLAHQTQMHNLITLTNYETRIAAYKEAAPAAWQKPADELVRYLLFADEAALTGKITGDSSFTQEFAALGPRDPRGRSLRDFDLEKRIFRYPCSYLIYSAAFDSIPEPAKSYIWRGLLNVLTGKDHSPAFGRISAADRRAVLEILLATKGGLPDEWKDYRPQSLQQTATKKGH